MKRFYTLCVVLLLLSSLLLSTYAQANGVENEPPDPATWMPDANLRNAVRAALRLNANEPLTQEKMLNLQGLNAPETWYKGSYRLRICDVSQVPINWRKSDSQPQTTGELGESQAFVYRWQSHPTYQTLSELDQSQAIGNAPESGYRY